MQEETPIQRSPRMRGKVSKDSTLSKKSARESPMQIVSDHSPPYLEITSILKNHIEECGDGVEENIDDALADLPSTSSCRDELALEYVDPNTTLVPHKSTWITRFLEHLWKEQRKRKRDHEENNGSITIQKLLFQLYGQYLFVEALWKEENKKMNKIIVS